MTRKDWTLMVIAEGDSPLRPVQLQKSLFLISKALTPPQLQEANFYVFEPYDYGPFSRYIYLDADDLERNGLVTIQRPPEQRYNHYRITELGRQEAEALKSRLNPELRQYLGEVVKFTQTTSFNQLVSAIYAAYPEMKANSVFSG